jgi:hypothetical protein
VKVISYFGQKRTDDGHDRTSGLELHWVTDATHFGLPAISEH